jgi:hypothetical protein
MNSVICWLFEEILVMSFPCLRAGTPQRTGEKFVFAKPVPVLLKPGAEIQYLPGKILDSSRRNDNFRPHDIVRIVGSVFEVVKVDELVKSRKSLMIVIPAKAGIRAPASRCDQRGESPLSGDARS